MAMTMAASLVGCTGAKDNSSTNKQANTATNSSSNTTSDNQNNTVAGEVKPIEVNVDRYYDSEYSDKYEDYLLEAEREYVHMGDGSGDNIKNQINSEFEKNRYDDITETKKLIKQCKSDKKKIDKKMSYLDNKKVLIKRADTTVLSYINCTESFSGGAHGLGARFGVNYDSQTGTKLKIEDVCTDMTKLETIIKDTLKEKYKKKKFSFMKDYFKYIESGESEYNFCVGNTGVKFIFNPYDIEAYAEGSFEITIPYSSGIFQGKYATVLDDYIMGIQTDEEIEGDLNNDGKEDTISVQTEYDESGDHINKIRLTVNGKVTAIETGDLDMEFYYVSRKDMVDCIYAVGSIENDYNRIYVITAKKNKAIQVGKTVDKSIREYVAKKNDPDGKKVEFTRRYIPVDPNNIYLSDKSDLLSSYMVYTAYEVNEEGKPAAKEDYYRTDEKSIFSVTLTLKKPMTFKVVDDEKGVETSDTYEGKTGEKFVICATNLVDAVDFKTEDEKTVRLRVELDNDKYVNGQAVDGKDIGDIFKKLYFAG